MKRFALAALLGLTALFRPADAGQGTGVVNYLLVSANSGGPPFVLVGVVSGITGAPSCATNGRFAFSLQTEVEIAWLLLLADAKKSGAQVQISGTNTCTVSGGRETVNSVQLL